MIRKYVAIQGIKPYSIDIKDKSLLFDTYDSYVQTFGDLFIGLYDSYETAEEYLRINYELFGDVDLSSDLETINYLEKCLALNLDTNI